MTTRDVVIPDLGEIVTTVRVVRWVRQVGEKVGEGDDLVEITTDKIDVILPSPAEGVLVVIESGPGERVPVGAVIGRIS